MGGERRGLAKGIIYKHDTEGNVHPYPQSGCVCVRLSSPEDQAPAWRDGERNISESGRSWADSLAKAVWHACMAGWHAVQR